MLNAIRLKFVSAISLISFLLSTHIAQAYDVTGEWTLSPVGAAAQSLVLQQTGTALSGTGSVGSSHWTYDGQSSVIGNAVKLHYVYQGISYNGFYNGTLTDDNHMSGTSVDSNNATGTWSAVRTSTTPGSGGSGGGETGANGGTSGSQVQIICNRGPNATDDFVCTATVTNTTANTAAPTGIVHWSLDRGAFRYGSECMLRNEPAHGNSSYCSVTWIQGTPVIQIGEVVPVDALYKGDGVYQTAASVRPTSNVVSTPKLSVICVTRNQSNCIGLNVDNVDVAYVNGVSGYVDLAAYTSPAPFTSALKAARAASTSASLKAPKKAGEIAFEVSLILKSSNNKFLKSLTALQQFGSKLQAGMVLSSGHATLAYGAKKHLVLKLSSDAKKVFAAVRKAKHSSLKAALIVKAIRKGDKQAKTISKSSTITL